MRCSHSATALLITIGCLSAPLLAGEPGVIYAWTMDEDPGWTMTGEWEWGQPLGQGGEFFGLPDPVGGYTGANAIGMNHAGDHSEKVGGPYELRTPEVDCSNLVATRLRFHRWLNLDWQPWLFSYIEVSNNGIDWVELWNNGTTEIVEDQWTQYTYDISAVADGESTVSIRWTYEIAPQVWVFSGWNIDDVEILGIPVDCPGDISGDGQVGVDDLLAVIAGWGELYDVDDLLTVIGSWGPCNA
jgi:hypothetical protein